MRVHVIGSIEKPEFPALTRTMAGVSIRQSSLGACGIIRPFGSFETDEFTFGEAGEEATLYTLYAHNCTGELIVNGDRLLVVDTRPVGCVLTDKSEAISCPIRVRLRGINRSAVPVNGGVNANIVSYE